MYILDTKNDENYFILINGDSKIKFSKKANTLEKIIAYLKQIGVKDLKVI